LTFFIFRRSIFGMRRVKTPSFMVASALPPSTSSGRIISLEKAPQKHSW